MSTLVTKCEKGCTCSYCKGKDSKLHYGLNIPALWKDWNAWWVIKYWPRCYFRFTTPTIFTLLPNGKRRPS